jgi:hypothetical protein
MRSIPTTVNFTYLDRHPAVISLTAAGLAGLALWVSRASFDVAGTIEQPVRIAMLPAPSELAGLTMMAMLFAAAIAWLVRGPRSGADHAAPFWNRTAAEILTPLFALGFLVLPYLPWIADWVPALRLLAGPARVLVWVIVLGQIAWLFVPHVIKRYGVKTPPGPFATSVMLAVISFAVYAWPSWHSIGMRVTDWPPLIIAAAIAALIWIWSFAVSQSRAAATFAWAAVCLSAPFVLNSRVLLPAPLLDLFNTIRHLPSASMMALVSGAPGLLFDQEFGIVTHAPVLLLGFFGLAVMVGNQMTRALSAALIAGMILLIALAGSRDPWWTDSMMPGRSLLLMLPLMGPPIAWLYERARDNQLRRAGLQLLLLVSVGMSLVIALNADQVRLPQDGDGSSSMLIWMSPTWQLWDESPTYIAGVSVAAVTQTALWLAAFAAAGWLFSRLAIAPRGSAALVATTTAIVAVIAVVSTSAVLPIDATRRRFDAEGRVLFPMLETFNTVVRPVAVVYDPLSVVSPAEVPPLFSLSAVPGQRRSRQPLRVVLNARFRLPAGEYELDIKGSDQAGTVPDSSLGLQIGREGRPLETWPLSLAPGSVSQRRFRVPLDAEFVGFRASRPTERTIAQLRLRALTIEDQDRRFESPVVRSSADFGVARAFFHDGDSFPEEDGLWVKGGATARLTILKPSESQTSLPLAIHGGGRENVAIVETPAWSQRIELVPDIMSKIAIPSMAGERFVSLSVTSVNGFIPAEEERGSKDRRLLGVWVAFIPDDTAKTSEGR